MKSPKLTALIDFENSVGPTANALESVFGDRALLNSNSIFRKIRNLTVNNGYRYTSDFLPLYSSLPFTQLEEIHRTKTIPYVANRPAIQFVAKKVNDSTWDDVADGFQRCFVFHESCHAVARSEIQKFIPEQQRGLPLNISELTFLSLLEESFANTCELMGIVDCKTPLDTTFYEANSYTALSDVKHDLLQLSGLVGAKPFFQYLQLCYLNCCFLRDELTERDFKHICELAQINVDDSRTKKRLKSISQVPFTLDRNFREVTTRLHLKINGYRTDLEQMNPLEFFETSRGFLSLLDQLSGLVTE